MLYIIIADVKYYEKGPSVQSYINIQDEGVFWDDGSMEVWDEYQRAVRFAEGLRNNEMALSRNYAEVKNIKIQEVKLFDIS